MSSSALQIWIHLGPAGLLGARDFGEVRLLPLHPYYLQKEVSLILDWNQEHAVGLPLITGRRFSPQARYTRKRMELFL